MQKRALGKTGLRVSEIAFGGVEIGIPYGIGVKSKEDMLSESEAIDLLHLAIDSGINFFDTARMYGESERIMGEAFKGCRDKVLICTKCRHFVDPDGNIPEDDALEKIIESSLEESLKTLQTDHVDVFMLHQAPMKVLENEKIADIFLKLQRSGRITATGASTYKPEETKKAIESGVWNVIQLPYNLMDQRQSEFFSKALQSGVGLVIRSVLLKGLLSDRGRGLHPALSDVEEHLKIYNELLDGKDYNLPALATKFALSNPEVSSVLVGIDRREYLEQSLVAADGKYLDNKSLQRAKDLAYPDPEFLNLPYWDRMNWLK
jgi:aryl-alcohol dehydrogenase-like predicted oxidoreductase